MNGQHDPRDFSQPFGHTPPMEPGPLPVRNAPDGLAITSLVLGIFSLATLPAAFCICPGLGAPFALGGLICGVLSKYRGGVRTAGIVCSAVALAASLMWLAVFVVLALASPQSQGFTP